MCAEARAGASPALLLRHCTGSKGDLELSLRLRTATLFYPCMKYINNLWCSHPIKPVVFAEKLRVPRQPKVEN